MDAVTYPARQVVSFVKNHFIALRIHIDDEPLSKGWQSIWTPSFAVLDGEGNELQRTTGFTGADEFIARMLLGLAKVRLAAGEYTTAIIPLESLLESFPKCHAVQEALYLRGVTLFKETKDPKRLKETYLKLKSDYPDSVWVERASPYRLL
ncbi:MAG: tetratricopeptide repeat protein [Desulforhopalus sp.]